MNKYFVIYPNGRQRLEATDQISALIEFDTHWTATAHYTGNKKGRPLVRRLIEETQEEIKIDADLHVTPYAEYNVEDEE